MPEYVTPTVHVVGQMFVDREALADYLLEIDDDLGSWVRARNDIDDMSLLTEVMGRLCYRSFAPGLNPNVTRIRDDTGSYIRNLLSQDHGSVFEHATISFVLRNVPRVFTHELVRHRVGVAISQESMRYVRLDEIPFYFPEVLQRPFPIENGKMWVDNLRSESDWLLARIEEFIRRWSGILELDKEGQSFEWKKQVTSALRYWAPEGVATTIGWTVNVRELRLVIERRTHPSSEEAMRVVFAKVAEYVTKEWPHLFGDFKKQADGSWSSL